MAKPEETYSPREPLAVDAARVTLNNDGFGWREFLVRLPEGLVADDLKEPTIWRKVQGGPNSFRRHDHLYLVSFDETWVADAIVADADKRQAVLCKPRVTTFPARYDQFFQDENYRVIWTGAGYCVERKRDGHRMTQPTANAALAERDLTRLYPVTI